MTAASNTTSNAASNTRPDATPAAAPDARVETPPVLTIDGVRIRHAEQDRCTPDNITFTVRPGEVVLLLGPSGCGKSTLTLAMNGLIPHAIAATLDGTVTVGGVSTADTSPARLSENVAMVFQDPDAQIVTGSVLDEVCFGPENLRLPVEVVRGRAETALRQVGLWERRAESPDRLSGGGRQRLAIACALALDAPLLVLDEPTANLDPAGIDEVYAVLRSLVEGPSNRAIVLVEHNLDAAIDLVDRVVVLDAAGRLAFDGPVGPTLRNNADALLQLGVWLPVATLAALRLRAAGLQLDPLPLTPAELRAALDSVPADAVPADAVPADAVPERGRRQLQQDREDAALIQVRELTVHTGKVPVLHEVSLDIHRGDFLAVIGINGAGKTTLVQAIAGVVPSPRAAVRLGQLDVGRAGARERAAHVGFVFQNPEHQFLAYTVFDELAHGLRIRKVAAAEIDARVSAMLERFGLADVRDRHPFLLSGGQKRRLSVGSALIDGADVLVLDEPTFGQDRARAGELLAILDDLNAAGTTVIIVTHDLQLVAEHASHVAVLSGGRLLAHVRTEAAFADAALIDRAGLRLPPLAQAMRGLRKHPELQGVVRLSDLPGPSL
ncbi:ABC transporter ATP-binding protein [Rathayibacter soli]|uniref:ABC transporter ATP-binding protein n=1 Tax=Rathayibacter soli TaxID=3144168 RepID=UPI0027E561DF|nr:ABC transporter ATP-binding protein [Glaciibacter superstes]